MVKHLTVTAALASAVSLVGTAAAVLHLSGHSPGQVTSVDAKRGTLVAIALPAQASSSGLVWRPGGGSTPRSLASCPKERSGGR